MNKPLSPSSNRAVAWWLLTGVGMIMIQVLIGGITRLTESGLSITEWKPITGILPPIGDLAWQTEFDKYKQTDQFRYLHSDFSLSDFKFIFFWEWFHRFWARLLGIVFIVGFAWFIWKKKFKREMIIPLIILFLLGALQGAIGWIMVKSGLVPEKYFVGHVELATHFVAALILLVYTLWFALRLLVPGRQIVRCIPLKRFTVLLLLLLFVQLVYGGFMAGLKAATVAPTWPTINGEWFPASLFTTSGVGNYINNPFMVQFIHRAIAYLFVVFIVAWFVKAQKVAASSWLNKTRALPLLLVLAQVLLGILTVLYSPSAGALVWLGVLHQFTAMLLLVSLVWILFLVKK
ncbi:COX15/CtaA family protein [Agriterribacter sp.]|uniref:COX15/CtaA family protein n=1 Tax=Agriterribacter sp. TaxID=2821509 RepID=UPI002C8D6976|nr:COX15/CtaA family protein [Agriterribacter sp.]HRP55205.1 COX15/CtaA family protein [Agriterribacter sp.]